VIMDQRRRPRRGVPFVVLPCNISVRDSLLGGSSSNGIAVSSAGAVFRVMVTNSTIVFNSGVGAAVAGASGILLLGGNQISSNVTGVEVRHG